MSVATATAPFELPAAREAIRFLWRPPHFAPATHWVHRLLITPRSFTGWLKVMEELRTPPYAPSRAVPAPPPPPYISNTVPDLWFHRAIAADMLESWFLKNQAVRFQMRRLVAAWSKRRMDRHVIGEDADVGTLEPIAPIHRVYVYDWGSRRKYCFHVSTLHQQIVSALRYQHMAIANPQPPKNPYTNLPWSYGQLIAIIDALHATLWRLGRRALDSAVQIFQRNGYDLERYRQAYGFPLERDCARRFFFDPTCEYWEVLYDEMLTEIVGIIRPMRRVLGFNGFLLTRGLPKDMLEAWDRMVFAYWCYANLSRMVLPNICSIYDLMDETKALYRRTEDFIIEARNARRKKVIPRRRVEDTDDGSDEDTGSNTTNDRNETECARNRAPAMAR